MLEIGAGLGTYAFFAADAGAAKVWAIDGHPVIHVARTIGRLNGYADRVTFVRGWLPEAVPADPPDVVIFEDFPPRLVDARVWRLLRDLRRVGLASGVRFVPAAAELFLAPVESARLAGDLTLDAERELHGLDWSVTREYVVHAAHRVHVPPEALVHPGVPLAAVRFDQPLEAGACSGEVVIRMERAARINGLAQWFELVLCEGVRVSNRPGELPGSWGQLFLPVDPPLEVREGCVLRVRIGAQPLPDGAPGWLAWDVTSDAGDRHGNEFQAEPLGVQDLLAASRDAVPRLNDAGRRAAEILGLVDGQRTIGEIASLLARKDAGRGRPELEELVVRELRDKISTEGITRSGGRAP